jgi:hypothetical protein
MRLTSKDPYADRGWSSDTDSRTSGFEGSQHPVRAHVRERMFFCYEGV